MAREITLRQIRTVIAVCEEGSFTRAAKRENATQSGVSQHIAAVERAVGARLFERTRYGVRPTSAGARYYRRCLDVVGTLQIGSEEIRAVAGQVSGHMSVGLMPTFTRAALAPVLQHYVRDLPDVKLRLVEGYSAMLTDMVLAEELDFAIVPSFEGRLGLKSRVLARDREMLISGRGSRLKPLRPVRLATCSPLKIVVPGKHNIRRRNLETYFNTNGIQIKDMIEMDAMIGTLEFVARSDWVTVLPSIICINDVGRGDLVVNPIVDPPFFSEFVAITPSRRPLNVQARLFLDRIEAEIANIRFAWKDKFKSHRRKARKKESRSRKRR